MTRGFRPDLPHEQPSLARQPRFEGAHRGRVGPAPAIEVRRGFERPRASSSARGAAQGDLVVASLGAGEARVALDNGSRFGQNPGRQDGPGSIRTSVECVPQVGAENERLRRDPRAHVNEGAEVGLPQHHEIVDEQAVARRDEPPPGLPFVLTWRVRS